jgi:hypothetical protein
MATAQLVQAEHFRMSRLSLLFLASAAASSAAGVAIGIGIGMGV